MICLPSVLGPDKQVTYLFVGSLLELVIPEAHRPENGGPNQAVCNEEPTRVCSVEHEGEFCTLSAIFLPLEEPLRQIVANGGQECTFQLPLCFLHLISFCSIV